MRPQILAFLLILPFSFAWVYPHQSHYSADPYEHIRLCATVYSESNAALSLKCGGTLVGERNVVANVPAIVCYDYAPRESTTCVWSDGTSASSVKIDVFPSTLVNALLAVVLVVLIVRFTVRLVRIYM